MSKTTRPVWVGLSVGMAGILSLGSTGCPAAEGDDDCVGEACDEQDDPWPAFAWTADPEGDLIGNESSVAATYSAPWIDIAAHAGQCGSGPDAWGALDELAGVLVDLQGSASWAAETDVCVFAVQLYGALGEAFADDGDGNDHSFVFALALDSDGDPANDWQYQGDFDWDFARGTDRWYQLVHDHDSGETTLLVEQVDAQQQIAAVDDSAARVVAIGDTLYWLIGDDEFDPAVAGYRATAFGHDGTYSAADSGGDVSGADPTDPLATVAAG